MKNASEQSLRQILDDSMEAIYVTDEAYNILYVNRTARQMAKKLFRTEIEGQKCFQTLLGRDSPCPFCKMEQLTKDNYLVRTFSGATGRVFELRGKLIDWDGKPAHIEYIHNITAQSHAEKRVEEIAAQQRSLYEHIGVGMCLYRYHKDGTVRAVICNDAYRNIFRLPGGFDAGAPIAMEQFTFWKNDRQLMEEFLASVHQQKPFHRVCRMTDLDTGLPRSVIVNMECAPQADGEALWYVSAYDVTEWAERENQLDNMLRNTGGGIALYQITKGGEARTLMFTDGLAAMHGYTRREYEQVITQNAIDVVYPDDRPRLAKELAQSRKAQTRFSITYRVLHKTKGYIWVNLTAAPIGEDADGCMRYNAAFTNASRQFELYRQMLDNSENGVIVTDRETREVYFTNQAALRIMALSRRQCGRERDACRVENQNCTLCDASLLLPNPGALPRKARVDGHTYQVYTHHMQWMDRPAVAQYFSDVTEETELQSRLASDEERYRLVVEKSGIALMDQNMKTGAVYKNERFRQYLLSDAPNMDGCFSTQEGRAAVEEEDIPQLERFCDELQRSGTASGLLRLKMRDGSCRWTEMNALELSGKNGELLRKIAFFRDVDAVTRQYEDLKIRYDYEMTRQGSFENGVVERLLLDLTEDRVVRAANPHSATLTQLIGMSVEDLLAARAARANSETGKAALSRFMDRDAFLQAYYTGETPTLEMRAPVPGQTEPKYFLSSAQLAKNPGNGHILAFVETRDDDRARLGSMLMRRLMETSYESAVVVNAGTGAIKIGIRAGDAQFTLDLEESYDELSGERISQVVPLEDQTQVKEQMSLEAIRKMLRDKRQGSGRVTTVHGGELFHKLWTAAYFDEEEEYILITVADVTAVYQKDLQTAQQLKTALENARVASQAKSTFLARMSHEIRTPITTVAGVLELIRMACGKNELRPQEILEQVGVADSANQYLLSLINDILDISKIEKNELHLKQAPTNIRSMMLTMCAMLRPAAEQKKIHLEFRRKTNVSNWYCMDALRVQQILMNLLNNALKFTPEGGTVRFTGEVCRQEGSLATVRFVVADTGVGISEEFKSAVFEPFKQEYTDSRSGYGGTGIGLAISRSLARMMGGDVTFESKKGCGSTFVATMQLEIVPPQKDSPSPQSAEEHPMLDGIHVLLCEDNKVNQEIVRRLLEAAGCIVSVADDGQQAVDRFAAAKPGEISLVLMDIRMPVLDGLEAARRIRTLEKPDAKTIPIVAMSANAYEEDRQLSLAAGMNDHLSKPVDTGLLYRTIRKYTGA